ncbi:S66 family peptidase [Lacticaseibacillus saniviri]|uniref:U61 family carboxypeptidase n=1 Tax=Lacticaseibacillus saniviri JCM 17471 = DSM 24301 TaxID=1293598 RepID=A0A0R2MU94_9LACO|nr:S66 peptidase family protein [Lacticaseibacillus saniviri]KRO17001.1 U61 family carboxypeptidase [Lacticaseibacillus saniviri JCM 17471 = DSM 24301]
MVPLIPARLRPGDEIRIVSPSSSLAHIGGMQANLAAKTRLEKLGFTVTFGQHIADNDILESASIASRVADLHEAFRDSHVKAILTTIGGYTANDLLPYIDWQLIADHPKIFCGYSDITILCNAIFARTGLVTYYGPSYSSFKMVALQDYQTQAFLNAVSADYPQPLTASTEWSSDAWFLPQPRKLHPNRWGVYHAGQTTGVSMGGNHATLPLLFGTAYLPSVPDPVLFFESSEGSAVQDFNRDLAQTLQVLPHLKALLIGRFPKETGMTEAKMRYILDKFPLLQTIPVIYDLNVGHTQPIFTVPIGQALTVDTDKLTLTF